MKLIVGLGNPGRVYTSSRHNIGFLVLDALAKNAGIKLKKHFGTRWISGRGRIFGNEVVLAEPLTFMNLSGSAVRALVRKHKIDLENLLVVSDDLDLEFGRLRVKDAGSSGGHRGIQSMIDSLGRMDFSRLRVGIGRPLKASDAAEYVLSPFGKKEKEQLSRILERAVACCETWVQKGTKESMNIFNRRTNDNE